MVAETIENNCLDVDHENGALFIKKVFNQRNSALSHKISVPN